MLKLIAPVVKNPVTLQNLENLDNTTSTPIKTKATTSKTTPVNSRNTGPFLSKIYDNLTQNP